MTTSRKSESKRGCGCAFGTCFVWTFLALVVILLLIVIIIFGSFRSAERLVQAELVRIREAGEPTDDKSMEEWFRAQTHSEGTVAWQQIIAQTDSLIEKSANMSQLPILGETELPEPFQPDLAWPEEPAVAEFLSAARPLIDSIGKASNYPTPVWMPIEFEGIDTLLKECQSARNVSRVLKLELTHAIYHRDKNRALMALQAMKTTADAFDWQAFIVADLVHSALDQIYLSSLASSLEYDMWEEQELREWLQSLGKSADVTLRWRNAVAGERYSFLSESTAWGLTIGGSDAIPDHVMRLPQTRMKLLSAYREAQDLGEGELVDLVARTSRFEAEQEADGGLMQLHPGNYAIGLMMPAYSAFAWTQERNEDIRRFVRTGLAIKLFEIQVSRWPESLLELEQIGLTQNDWTSLNHGTFGYSVEGDQAWVWSYPPSKPQSSIPTSRPDWNKKDESGVDVFSIR